MKGYGIRRRVEVVVIVDLCVFLISTYIALRAVTKIYHGRYSMLHFCVLIFYAMQVLPIFVSLFGKLDKIQLYYEYMYYAMIDDSVAYIYDLFAITGMLILSYNADKLSKYSNVSVLSNFKLGAKRQYIVAMAAICMVLPLFGIILAPHPQVYLKFSYFYMNEYSNTGVDYLYHRTIMKILTYISFAGMMVFYYLAKRNKKLYTYLVLILVTWVNGKRTLMVFMIAGILVIDFLKCDKHSRRYINRLIWKAIFFGIIFVGYYLFYNDKTGKSNFADDYLLYATYFSRMSNVKVSIYDLLNQGKMLQYPCQTLLYNLLFFIPRVLWEGKPYPYYKYFTSYVYYGVSNKVVPNMQFQVNIWSEFISNMGIFGYVAALYLVIWIVKKSEKSSNSIIMLSGTVFAFLYMMYGFEHIIQITYVVWAVSSIWTFIWSKFKLVHGR